MAPQGTPRFLQLGAKYDPNPLREDTRARLAKNLVLLLCFVSALLIVLTAASCLTIEETKDLAVAILTPIVAVTGTALGFYFGGHKGD